MKGMSDSSFAPLRDRAMLHIMMRLGPLACAALLVAGCKDQPKPTATTAASAAPTAVKAAPHVVVAKAKALDVARLQKALRCTKGSAHAGPCGVLAAFENCVALPRLTQAGESRYLGEGYRVKSGAFVDEFTLLKRWSITTKEAGVGQMPNKFAIGAIPDTRSAAIRHAKKAISKYRRGDVTKAMNAAVRYVKERTDWSQARATPAEKNQVYISSTGPAYLCPLKNQRVLLVQQSALSDKAGDGVYATLWPVSW